MFEFLIGQYADLQKVAQLLAILVLGVPDVGPFLKKFAWIGLSKFLFGWQSSLTGIIKIIVFIHEGFETARKRNLQEQP